MAITMTLTASETYGSLVGTIGFRIHDCSGNEIDARTTAGVVEQVSGSGIYSVGVSDAYGGYVIVWDTGGASPMYAADPIVASASGALTAGQDTKLTEIHTATQAGS